MMKIGLVSAILPDSTFEEVIDYAEKVGFKCVEVCCWPKGKAARRYAGITHINTDGLTKEKMNYYSDYAKKHHVEISSLGYYPNPLDANKEAAQVAVDHINDLIDVSAEMGINMVTTFIGRDKNKNVDENLQLFEKTWKPIIAHAEEKKVRIAIENCPMLYTENEWPGGNNLACSTFIWRKMFEIIPSNYFGLNFDPSHLYLTHASYTKPLYEFKDKIFHVHFKDIRIYQDKLDEYGVFAYPALWHSPKLPGLGGVNFAEFCSALNDIRYSGPACIEIEDKAFEGSADDVKRGIEQSFRFMSQYL